MLHRKSVELSNGQQTRYITAATLVVLGGKNDAIGSADAAAARTRHNIAGSEIEILPDAGHLMNYDEPELIGSYDCELPSKTHG